MTCGEHGAQEDQKANREQLFFIYNDTKKKKSICIYIFFFSLFFFSLYIYKIKDITSVKEGHRGHG